MEKQCFRIHYLGLEKVKLSEIKQALKTTEFLNSNQWKLEEIECTYEQCEVCVGAGNVDGKFCFNMG